MVNFCHCGNAIGSDLALWKSKSNGKEVYERNTTKVLYRKFKGWSVIA